MLVDDPIKDGKWGEWKIPQLGQSELGIRAEMGKGV